MLLSAIRMCEECGWDFMLAMISEGYKRESIACDRPVAHFVKGHFWLVPG